MAKAVILKTNVGVHLMGAIECSNRAIFNAEGCFKYCNESNIEEKNIHQASKLICSSTLLGHDRVESKHWYKDKDNFVDVEINFDTDQSYKACR